MAQRLGVIDRHHVCGRRLAGLHVAVTLNDSVAHFNGVRSCGLVWSCGVCGPKIRQRRSEEVGVALGTAEVLGLGLAFLTLTVRHHRGDSLEHVYDLQEQAWRALQQSRAWRRCMDELGVLGHIVFREVTWGAENGWHPHRHVVLVLERPVGAAQLEDWSSRAWAAWEHQLARRGLSSTERHGLDVRAVNTRSAGGVAWYVAKVAQEMTRGDLKRARGHSHFTPEQLLDLVAEDGDAEAADLWREFARVTSGRRMLNWSNGLRQLLALSPEQTDEEIAEEQVGGEVVAILEKEAWRAILRARAGLDVLEAAEASAVDLWAFLAGVAPPGSYQVLAPFASG